MPNCCRNIENEKTLQQSSDIIECSKNSNVNIVIEELNICKNEISDFLYDGDDELMNSSISSPSSHDNNIHSMPKYNQSDRPVDDCPGLLTDFSDVESNISLPLNNDCSLPNEQIRKSEKENILQILNNDNLSQHSKVNSNVNENKSHGINYCRGKIDIEIDLLSDKIASVKVSVKDFLKIDIYLELPNYF